LFPHLLYRRVREAMAFRPLFQVRNRGALALGLRLLPHEPFRCGPLETYLLQGLKSMVTFSPANPRAKNYLLTSEGL